MDTPSIGITAIGYALPEHAVDLQTLDQRGLLDSPVDVLTEFGFRWVHVSDRPAEELALIALRRLIDENGIDPESVDALLYAGAIPESHRVADDGGALEGFNYPVARLQYEAGLINATTIGIGQAGCTGLLSAVTLAVDHIRANPEVWRVICASADVLPAEHKREIIYNVVSDGACAVLVERDGVRNRILAHRHVARGYYWNAGARKNEIVAAYFPTSRTIVRETFSACGLSADDIALIVPHNVSLRSWQILLPLSGHVAGPAVRRQYRRQRARHRRGQLHQPEGRMGSRPDHRRRPPDAVQFRVRRQLGVPPSRGVTRGEHWWSSSS